MNMELLDLGQIERKTQDKIVTLFQDKLDYIYLGNWEEREAEIDEERGKRNE